MPARKGSSPNLVLQAEDDASVRPHTASIACNPEELPPEFVAGVLALQKLVGMPVWLLIQQGDGRCSRLDINLVDAFLDEREAIQGPMALLIDSPGGQAKYAYQLAVLLRDRCQSWTAVIPSYAKSAATMLTLGADHIWLGQGAELGPLDTQYFDEERQRRRSTLDEVQSIERLQASALDVVDQAMRTWLGHSIGGREQTFLPIAASFAAELMRPCFEKIDVGQYTERSRIQKEAEEYAVRLLDPRFASLIPPADDYGVVARRVAGALVERYPTHDFYIGRDEAAGLALPIEDLTTEQESCLDLLAGILRHTQIVAIGQMREVEPDENEASH